MEACSEITSERYWLHVLMRIRIGSLYIAYRLADGGIIDWQYLSTCPCHGDSECEVLKYMILEVADSATRGLEYLVISYYVSKISKTTTTLEGSKNVDRNLRVQLTVASTSYFALIIPFYVLLLKSLALVLPGTNFQMFTGAVRGRRFVLSFVSSCTLLIESLGSYDCLINAVFGGE